MTELSSATTVLRDPELLFSPVNHDLVIFQVKQSAYFSLDEIGADIWRRIECPVTVSALCDDLATEYQADRAVIERDVLALLTQMTAAELIELRLP
ncbi:PqqD family protein [Magnetospirillum molischianum]|uniref:Coenzyme PQQ synthesis protein D (PqqD) n=1 Tax=Magnetospirillum molischianum DSM 120 TaxID=1150626 RepID=H8FWE5_MAGML|nr:PqqD family protein [Magnetospirillum molischianum]CCG42683.1 conserved hypothetical protein [Magnetospirillum molischianum DSM 120]